MYLQQIISFKKKSHLQTKLIIIIIIHNSYKAHIYYQLDQGTVHYYPLLIRRINHSWNHLTSLGSIQLNCCHFGAYRTNQTQQPTLPSQGTHLLLGGENQLWWSVLLKNISTTVAARIRTHIPTTQPSEHKSDRLNRSTMALHIINYNR